MAAPVNKPSCWSTSEVYKHHEQQKICISRPKYREGRRDRAVKVYTINLESRYLMVQGVPAIGVMAELVQLCALYGVVEEYRPLDEYPAEEFTEVYLVKFQKLPSARAAKRHMDEKSFYGGVLHVCYVPEYKTVEDTRLKLQDRRRYVIRTTQNKVREKDQMEEEDIKPTGHDKMPPSDRTSCRPQPISDSSNTGESSSSRYYLGFPLLPLPPQEEDYHYRHNQTQAKLHRATPTEDKMGTLHNAIVEASQEPCSKVQGPFSSGDRRVEGKATSNQAAAARFLPRSTHLEKRKRRLEQTQDPLAFEVPRESDPLIGPKLPEPPKLDMGDESLNRTADLIRNTMNKVTAIPEVKPAEKKVKPRRRI